MTTQVRKILVIDDNQAVHEDYRKVLIDRQDDSQLDEMESLLFGDVSPKVKNLGFSFEIDSAYQGEDGFSLVKESLAAGYALLHGFHRHANATWLERDQNRAKKSGKLITTSQS